MLNIGDSNKKKGDNLVSTCQPFAVMRLTHEAIRSGLNDLENMLGDEAEIPWESARKSFDQVSQCIKLHAAQEDLEFYPHLEEKEQGISHDFTKDHQAEAAEIRSLNADLNYGKSAETDQQTLRNRLLAFIAKHREHLANEEVVLLKKLPELFTYFESVDVVRGILGHDINAFENMQLPWVYERLNHDQREMYKAMLKGCSPDDRYNKFCQIMDGIEKPSA